MKGKFKGASSKAASHGCAECGTHKGSIIPLQKKSGRRYTLCHECYQRRMAKQKTT